jgi:hypothetical protein
MELPPVFVIHEHPELGRSVLDLLESAGYRVGSAKGLEEIEGLVGPSNPSQRPLMVVASNQFYSGALKAWRKGTLSHLPLVIVGTRDPGLMSRERLHVVRLPLNVVHFLELIASLLPEGPARRAGN